MLKLALGSVPYFWPRNEVMRFYDEMAQAPVEIVYLGETVCAKRRQLYLEDWLALGEGLAAAGKQVVLSSLTLIEAESELGALRRLCTDSPFMVEANDMAAVQLLQGREFVAGTGVNIYNQHALSRLGRLGLRRWVLPVELGREDLAELQRLRPPGVETEVLAWGRLPLAHAARCFTARAHGLPKDDCRFRCRDYPDGLLLKTREGQPFLNLNGIQTQSALSQCLIGEVSALADLEVEVLRLVPQAQGTGEVVGLFDRVRRGALEPAEARRRLESLAPIGLCNGFYRGGAGMEMFLGREE